MALKIALHPLSLRAAPAAAGPQRRSHRSMRAAEIVTSVLLVALGGTFLVGSIRMGIGWGTDGPQGGFVPFWLATLMVCSSLAVTLQGARREYSRPFATREQLGFVLRVLIPVAAMVLLTGVVGLYLAAAIYTAFYMRWGGRHSWAFCLALPVAMVVAIFLVFERWFLVPLPKGPLEAWLGF